MRLVLSLLMFLGGTLSLLYFPARLKYIDSLRSFGRVAYRVLRLPVCLFPTAKSFSVKLLRPW